MYTSDPRNALSIAHERVVRLRDEAVAERARGTSQTRHVAATVLRCAADRLDPAPFAPRAAFGRPVLLEDR